MRYATHVSTKTTPQTEPILGEPQVQNSAGGYVYQLDTWGRLARFLVLGCDGGAYYVGERKLTQDNAACVLACLKADGPRAVRIIAEVSEAGRAPKNDPAIFALAMAAGLGNAETCTAALAALPRVCRIPTHLFQFVDAVQEFRGWGRGLRRAVGAWYQELPVEKLAYEVAKYQQREGWGNRDLLRLTHPKTPDAARNAIYKWIVDDELGEAAPALLHAYQQAKAADTKTLIKLIVDHNLTREMVPSEALTRPEVWEALLVQMPVTAMIRNLGVMTAIGLLQPLSAASRRIAARLLDAKRLKRARIHPLAILVAHKVYTQGAGMRGGKTWVPVTTIVDALDQAFYLAFGAVEPINTPVMLALDVSGSMASGSIAGSPLTPREGSAAMALVTAATEATYEIMGFSGRFIPLTISPRQRLADVINAISHLPFERTDCALPMLYALQQHRDVDGFVVYTDSETWAGAIHPSQALRQYRRVRRPAAKLAVVGMTATEFTIADPRDPGMLDVVGFDAATPSVLSGFLRG
jgi:60 kDa SS-A/Ro ribonucleoprotein